MLSGGNKLKGEIIEADQFSISRKCKQCGKEFKTEHMLNTICSDECRKVRRRASINEYNKHYQKTPKYKEIARRSYEKARAKPGYKEKYREYHRKWQEKNKLAVREYMKNYRRRMKENEL